MCAELFPQFLRRSSVHRSPLRTIFCKVPGKSETCSPLMLLSRKLPWSPSKSRVQNQKLLNGKNLNLLLNYFTFLRGCVDGGPNCIHCLFVILGVFAGE